MAREASVERNTKETEIKLKLTADGSGYTDIETGIGFFDHMLDGFARHGLFDLCIRVHGDLNVDDHHTVEDTGIVLGTAIREAAGDKKESAATEAVSCLWMRCWYFAPRICRDVLIFPGTRNFQRKNRGSFLGNDQGVLLCSVLYRRYEPACKSPDQRKQPSSCRGYI